MKNILWIFYALLLVLAGTNNGFAQYCSYDVIFQSELEERTEYAGGALVKFPLSVAGVSVHSTDGSFYLQAGSYNDGVNTKEVVYQMISYDYINDSENRWTETENITVTHYSPLITTSFSGLTTTDSDISLLASPSGGVFTGIGVTGSSFSPSDAEAGSHIVFYTYSSGGCSFTTQKTATVTEAIVIFGFNDKSDICENDGSISLSASPSGGTFSGTGVSGSSFYPSVAETGSHNLTYTVDGVSKTVTYTVNAIPNTTLNLPVSQINENDNSISLSGGSPSGGSYSGAGVSDGNFNPEDAGDGTHTITYTSPQNSYGCQSSATDNISVLEVINNIPDQSFCEGESHYLDPDGGAFYYNGSVISSTFTSSIFGGAGSYTVTWKKSGFADSDFTVTVYEKPSVSFSSRSYCQGSGNINLASYTSPDGGTYSGSNVSGTYFNTNASVGDYSITYTYSNGNCSTTKYATWSIMEEPTANLNLTEDNFYQDDATYILNGGSPSGGSYYVEGVRTSTFDPSDYDPGEYSVRYSYSNGNCSDSDYDQITVLETNAVFFPDLDLCENDDAVTLEEQGGTFYIDDAILTGGVFNPELIGEGIYSLTWKKDTYSDSEFIITVHALPEVSFAPLPGTCPSGSALDLTAYVTPEYQGAILNLESTTKSASADGDYETYFSGDGVMGTLFNPFIVAPGTFPITYTVTDDYCTNSASSEITVYEIPTVILNAPNVEYTDDAAVSLLGYANPAGGTFEINGEPATTFNPSQLGEGEHTITYTYTNAGGCSDAASVSVILRDREVYIFNDMNVCTGDGIVSLPENGGTYVVDGVIVFDYELDVSEMTAGTYVAQWNKDGYETGTFNLVVEETPEITAMPVDNQCIYGEALDLLDFVEPKTGTFSGNGISGSSFDPGVAKAGTHEILYTVTNGNCYSEYRLSITVIGVEALNFEGINGYCSTDGPVDLTAYVDQSGGTFFCEDGGIMGNTLYPEQLDEGNHTVTYTINVGSGCEQLDEAIINVMHPPTVTLAAFADVWVDADPFTLYGGSPSGGSYYVNGQLTNTLNPAQLGLGTYTVRYVYSNSACENSAETEITIAPLQTSSFIDRDVCLADAPLNLQENGGVFLVDGTELEDGIFNPASFGVGAWNITWEKEGFEDTHFTIHVYKSPDVIFVQVPDQCVDGESIDLTYFVEPKDGNFSGAGLYDVSFFDPSRVGSGEYSVLYTIKNDYCYRELEIPITVNELDDITFNGLDIVCKNSSPVDLSQFVSVPGGRFSCEDGGVIDNNLFPSMLEAGAHTISYTIENSGCSKTEEQLIYIVEPEDVSFDLSAFENLYSNSAPVFMNFASPLGGIYYVNGSQTNVFDPAELGSGLHSISYDYTDNVTGCSGIRDINVTVKGEKLSNFGDRQVCQHDQAIEFDLDGGTMYIDDVRINSIFYPEFYSPGEHTARWVKDGYADTEFIITVLESTDINTFEIPDLCETDNQIDLYDYVEPKTGTFAGSGLVDGQYFDPSIYGGGEFDIVYTVKNDLCYDEAALTITVNGMDDVVFEGLPYSICNAAEQFDLMDYVYPKTGEFSNEQGAVINNILYPSLLTNGLHTIVYTISNPSGCDVVKEKQIYILEEPGATLSVATDICQSAESFRFTGGSPIGGKYYVDGKEVILFVPSDYTAGLHLVEYSVTNAMGCETVATAYINIVAAPGVTLQAQDRLCDNGEAIALQGGYPYGGQYFINGEAMTTFDPGVYGAGNYLLTYQITENGCTATAEQSLQVAQTTKVSIYEISDICNNALPVELSQGSPAGGYYTIDRKTVESLEPSTLTEGMHTLTYNLENNGCISEASTEFQVLETENFSVNVPFNICENSNVMSLSVVTPSGGTYSGSGITSNQFDPSAIGEGTFYYEYYYESDNGCQSVIPFTMTVNPAPEIEISDISRVCTNADAFALSASPTGGTFSGIGVVNSVYYPSLASAGIQNITYEVENKYGCSASKTMSILVNEPEELSIEDIGNICQNGDAMELNFISPSGGEYSGTGIVDNVLYPYRLTAGVKTVAYQYTDRNGCVSEAETKITIREQPDIDDFYLSSLCSNDEPVELDTEMLYTKSVYMGKGVVNNTFDPEVAGAGTSTIRYLVVDDEGCSNYSEKSVEVKEAPYVFIQSKAFCEGDQEIELENGYPGGGTFQGNFIVDNSFIPLATGIYDVRYDYTASNGCSEEATNYITVNEIPDVVMKSISNICVNSDPVQLEASTEGGYFYLDDETEPITEFDPSVYGVGEYTIHYIVENSSGCSGEASQSFKVMETELVSIVDLKSTYCQNAEAFNLAQKGYPQGGLFMVNGDITYQLDPSEMNVGTNSVEYSYDTEVGCNVTISQDVKISAVPEAPEMELKSVYCPGDVIPVEPKNYVEGLDIIVETANEQIQKVDYGQKSFEASEVEQLDIYYQSADGCQSILKSYEIEVEIRNPGFATEKQNINKGEALQILALDDYSYITDYEWTFSDGGVSYDSEPYHYFNIPGKNSFYLDYTTQAGCTFSKAWVDYVWVNNTDNLTTGVDENASVKTTLYPNPATDIVNVVPGENGEYRIAIFDSNGELRKTQENNKGKATVELHTFASGTYTMLLVFKDKTASKLFVVQ